MPLIETAQLWAAKNALKMIVYFVIALALFLSGVKVEHWRLSSKYEKERADAVQEARARERGMNNVREKVEQNAQVKEQKYRASLATANSDRDQLRNLVSQFNAYAMPGAASTPSSPDGAGADGGLLGGAERLARQGVGVVAAGDTMADRATQAAESCRNKVASLQEYIVKMRAQNGRIGQGN